MAFYLFDCIKNGRIPYNRGRHPRAAAPFFSKKSGKRSYTALNPYGSFPEPLNIRFHTARVVCPVKFENGVEYGIGFGFVMVWAGND